jgi:NTE family protein
MASHALAGFAVRHDPNAAGGPGLQPSGKVALCLSGGGFRSALFHLGALRRLNELGILGRIDTISSVSGGSILAAHLARTVDPWPRPGETFAGWEEKVAMPFRDFVGRNLRTPALLRYALKWRRSAASEALARLYAKRLTAQAMGDLPARPEFVFCATDMGFGAAWRFSRRLMGDSSIGHARTPADLPVARAVAASSCFPPVFDPLPFRTEAAWFTMRGSAPREGKAGQAWREIAGGGLELSDGGLYDNLGLDVVRRGHATILASDGGATFDPSPDRGFRKRLARYMEIQGKQGWEARIQRFNAEHGRTLRGAYWLIGHASRRGYSRDAVDEFVSEVRTDLDAFRDGEIQVLENHGYALADSKVATFAPELLPVSPPPYTPPHPHALDEAFVAKHLRRSHKRALPFGRFGRGPYSRRNKPSPTAPAAPITGFREEPRPARARKARDGPARAAPAARRR